MRVLLLLVLVASLFACGSTPVEPYVSAPPSFFAGSDLNASVVFSKLDATAGVRLLPATEASIHLAGPIHASVGKVICTRFKPEKTVVVLNPSDPLPSWVQHLFTPQEAAAFGVTFASP